MLGLLATFGVDVVVAFTFAVELPAGLSGELLSDLFECSILLRPSPGFACAVPDPTVKASAAAAVAIPARPATFVKFARLSG